MDLVDDASMKYSASFLEVKNYHGMPNMALIRVPRAGS